MYEDLADFSLKHLEKLGASYVEARLEDVKGSGYIIKNGNVELSGFDRSLGLGLRFIVDGTLGFISINEFRKDKITKLINKSFNLTRNSSKIGEKVELSEEKTVKANYKVNQKQKLDTINPEEKIKFLLDIDKEINQKYYRFFSLGDGITRKYFVNSEGTKIRHNKPRRKN